MTESKNLCEEVQIAILSDDKLSDIQKEHIESCEECRALLSQIESMKNDLGSISVPDIEEGRIAKSVMEKISKENASVPFPKYKITHHLGTAAAVAIILVAALMIKNPSETVNKSAEDNLNTPVSFDVNQNNHILRGISENETADTGNSENHEDLYRSYYDKTESGVIEESADEEIMYNYCKAVPESSNSETKKASNDTVTNDGISLLSDADSNDSHDDSPVHDVTEEAPMMFSASKEVQEQSISDLTTDAIDSNTVNSVLGSAGAGGGGGSSELKSFRPSSGGAAAAVEESDDDVAEAVKEEEVKDTKIEASEESLSESEIEEINASQNFIFKDIEFEHGEDRFDYNISLANKRLFELYGEEYVVSKEKLIALGLDNEMFIKLAYSITEELFGLYKAAFDIFE